MEPRDQNGDSKNYVYIFEGSYAKDHSILVLGSVPGLLYCGNPHTGKAVCRDVGSSSGPLFKKCTWLLESGCRVTEKVGVP